MLRRVLVLGGIATAHVAATQAKAKVHPCVAGLQALFASLGVGLDVFDLVEVLTLGHTPGLL
jgi:hypothetical protein